MLKISALLFLFIFVSWHRLPEDKKQLPPVVSPLTIDGPYIFYNSESIVIQYIDSADGKVSLRTTLLEQSKKDQVLLDVNTDETGKIFKVKLHSKLTPEKSTYGKVSKMFVLSDIEGEFAAFRKLLQGNGVMDANYQWTFGDGHLVLVGDFVDRGTMVTEVLWLIYSLESQAEAAGGKVHFILGNHEIMNMNGNHHYVNPKYKKHASQMNITYQQLFSRQSEMGRWLATKNIAERVGNAVFAHAGFSTYMNIVQMDIKQINDTARLYYSDTSANLPSIYAELLFSDDGPFWYRGYYYGKSRATMGQVDSTLNLFNSKYIVTGHTIIANEIVALYKGKVINTDVHHKDGESEALLFEGSKIFRVNNKGEKMKINGRSD